MAWTLVSNPTFRHHVTLVVPGQDPDQSDEFSFLATFKALKLSEIQALQDGSYSDPDDLVLKFLVGWSGVLDEEGKEIPFSPEEVREACDVLPSFSGQLTNSYVSAMLDTTAKKRKPSVRTG